LLVDHAGWAASQGDRTAAFAARRLARQGVDLVSDEEEPSDATALVEI
jgi:hypothetical protein